MSGPDRCMRRRCREGPLRRSGPRHARFRGRVAAFPGKKRETEVSLFYLSPSSVVPALRAALFPFAGGLNIVYDLMFYRKWRSNSLS